MNPEQLLEFIAQRKWVALAAVIIGLIVRLLKSDTKIPIDIPPKYRFWLAIALGGAAGALDKLTNMEGVTWTSALVQGVTAAVIAIVSHNAFIDSLRGGKELVIPGLIKENTPPGPGKPPSIPPKGPDAPDLTPEPTAPDSSRLTKKMAKVDISKLLKKYPPKTRFQIFVSGVVLVVVMNLAACKLFTPENLPNTLLTFEQIACIMQNAFLDDKNLNVICNLINASQQQEAKRVAAAHRQSVQRQLASRQPEPVCDGGTTPSDAGFRDGASKF